MRVCMILEGSYPYVYGGVSSWMHQYIQAMPEVDFVLWCIGAQAVNRGHYKYELPENVDRSEQNIWLLTQQLTRAMAKGGVAACAEIIYSMFGSNAENAKDLAYRLYTIAERKNWTEEAYAYNSLVVAWPDIQSKAAELKAIQPEQLNLFDLNETL